MASTSIAPPSILYRSAARIGMVFQKPNPFPMSIYDNIASRPRTHKLATTKADLDGIVEKSLRGAALWDEVEDRLEIIRPRSLRRPTATPGHRAHARRLARRSS